METNSEMNTNRWVAHRLAKLNSGSDWQPNTARAFARFEERRGPFFRDLRWTVVAVIIACICIVAMLASRAIVTKRPAKVSAAGVTLKEGQAPPEEAARRLWQEIAGQ